MCLLFSKSTKEVLKMQEAVNSLHTLPIVVDRQGFRSISWQHQNKMALVFPLPGDLLSSFVGPNPGNLSNNLCAGFIQKLHLSYE